MIFDQVFAGKHPKHAGRSRRSGGIDRNDAGMGMGRADEHRMGQAVEDQIVEVAPATLEQARILDAR